MGGPERFELQRRHPVGGTRTSGEQDSARAALGHEPSERKPQPTESAGDELRLVRGEERVRDRVDQSGRSSVSAAQIDDDLADVLARGEQSERVLRLLRGK